MNPLLKGFMAACRPSDRRKVWEWNESHVVVDATSPFPGRWRSDRSPWVKEPMEAFSDNRVAEITIKCSAQSAKTQTVMGCLAWTISEDPGPALWVMAAKDEAKQFVRDRIAPTFDKCAPVSAAMLTEGVLEYTFAGMPLYFAGAGSPSKLQSKPIRWLFLDEVRNYPPGALATVLKRTRAFWNSRRMIVSTPDLKDDEVDSAYRAGDQRVYHVPCPACGHEQPLKFEQLKAAHPETGAACKWEDVPGARSPEGAWDFDLLAEWLRYECEQPDCGHLMPDVPAVRKALARHGRFIAMNPKAPRHKVSFHWNALLPPWVSWRSVAEEFVNARLAARNGDLQPLKTFINETLGESWDDQLGVIDEYGFLEDRELDYDVNAPWPDELARFMAADRQEKGGEHYWWVVRSIGKDGQSRLLGYGRCNSTAELEDRRRDYGVSVNNAMIDSGHKASEVYRFCSASGWKAFKGDDAEYFIGEDKATQKRVRRMWDKTQVDPSFGTRFAGLVRRTIPLFRWSNHSAKDALAEYMRGLIGGWSLFKGVGRDYLRQVTAERRAEKTDTKGRISYFWKQVRPDNHLFDCELMILVAGVITGFLRVPQRGGNVAPKVDGKSTST